MHGFDVATNALGEDLRVAKRAISGHDHEFFTTVAAQGIVGSERALNAGGDELQRGVAHAMAVRVVHVLEVIDVDQEQRERLTSACRVRKLAPQMSRQVARL